MNTNNKFKIGEFSKLNQITVKTLRHYEEIGLLIPNEVDEWTGYRYYDASQFQTISKILYLKKLHFSLEEIKDMFDEGNDTPTAEMVKEKLELCKQEQMLLQWRYEELSDLEKDLRKRKEMEKVFIKSLPAATVASFRKVVKDYGELFSLCPNLIGPEMARLGCTCDNTQYCFTVEHDKEHKETDIDIEYCEAVDNEFESSDCIKCRKISEVKTAVCINHLGSYDNFQQTMTILIGYIEQNGYRITESPRFCYIDGIWNKEKEEEWLTEIQVPVVLA